MSCIEVKTQAELDKALKSKGVVSGADWIACVGNGRFIVTESSRVVARESSSVVAWGSSRVEARGSSRVVAWGSSRVVARESSRVEARGSSSVVASKLVAVHKHTSYYDKPKVSGGVIIEVPEVTDLDSWIDFNGVKESRNWITVYKAVDANLKSGRGFEYPIGKKIKCDDFAATNRCGAGLHFSQSVSHAKQYFPEATRFLVCKVKKDEAVFIDGSKIKAPGCKVIEEVDRIGDPIPTK